MRGVRVTAPRDRDALYRPGYSAYIFDWDGTVADSHRANYSAVSSALRLVGVDISWEWYIARHGLSAGEMATAAAEEVGRRIDVPRVVESRDEFFLRVVADVAPVAPVASVIRRLQGGAPVAVATGGPRRTVLHPIDMWEIGHLFSAVVTRDDVSCGKPDPALFLRASELLGVPAEKCLVYEDSDEGLEAARRAGMDAVDVRPCLASERRGMTARTPS